MGCLWRKIRDGHHARCRAVSLEHELHFRGRYHAQRIESLEKELAEEREHLRDLTTRTGNERRALQHAINDGAEAELAALDLSMRHAVPTAVGQAILHAIDVLGRISRLAKVAKCVGAFRDGKPFEDQPRDGFERSIVAMQREFQELDSESQRIEAALDAMFPKPADS